MISNSLIKHQLKTKNHIKYSNLIQEYIYCYLSAQQYWILTKDHIIQLVQFGNKLKKQILQDVELGIERFMIEISEQFNFNQNDIDQIVQLKQNQFFFENFSADQTVQLIIEIFILLSGFKFQNHSLVIEKYEPSSHAFLLKFCEQINNGKWDFTSSQIINLADKVMGNVYFQIVQQINKGSKNYVKIEFKNDIIQIKMKNQLSNQNFQQTNQAYYYSMNYSFIGAQIQIENCLNKYYSQFIDKIVESKPKDLQKYNKPVVFYLQSPSENKVKSNVITIFVNGFLTQKDAQDKKLSPFYQDTNLETLILVWKASSVANLLSSSLKDAIINACFIDKIITPLITIIANLIMLFKNCFEEAKNVGKYLAYFLHQNYLGNKTINLIGFSLGTVIVYYCLKQLIKLQKESTQEKSLIVHNVLMMGGVADKNLLQKLDFRCISGTFHNVFSRNDQVLTKVLTIFDKKIYPCGLDPILSIHPNVKNHNFTNKVDGHFCYKEKILKEILELTNFDDQYLIF